MPADKTLEDVMRDLGFPVPDSPPVWIIPAFDLEAATLEDILSLWDMTGHDMQDDFARALTFAANEEARQSGEGAIDRVLDSLGFSAEDRAAADERAAARVAEGIRSKIASLNDSLRQAAELGLTVEFDTVDVTVHGDKARGLMLSATIERRLPL